MTGPRNGRSRPAQAAPEVPTTDTIVTADPDIADNGSPLTLAEVDARAVCEAIVDEGLRTFVEVGSALATIRDRKLYRATHGDFAGYAADRFGLSKSYAHRMIGAAAVALSPMGDTISNERQARALVPLLGDPDAMREVVERAQSAGKITAASLRAARDSGTVDMSSPVCDLDLAQCAQRDHELERLDARERAVLTEHRQRMAQKHGVSTYAKAIEVGEAELRRELSADPVAEAREALRRAQRAARQGDVDAVEEALAFLDLDELRDALVAEAESCEPAEGDAQ